MSPYQDFNRARKQRVVSFPRRKPNIAEAPQHGLARWSERLGAAWPAQSRKTVLILKHERYVQGNQESLLRYPWKCRLGTKRSYSKKKKQKTTIIIIKRWNLESDQGIPSPPYRTLRNAEEDIKEVHTRKEKTVFPSNLAETVYWFREKTRMENTRPLCNMSRHAVLGVFI